MPISVLFVVDSSYSMWDRIQPKAVNTVVRLREELLDLVDFRYNVFVIGRNEKYPTSFGKNMIHGNTGFDYDHYDGGGDGLISVLGRLSDYLVNHGLASSDTVVVFLTDGEFGYTCADEVVLELEGTVLGECNRAVYLMENDEDADICLALASSPCLVFRGEDVHAADILENSKGV